MWILCRKLKYSYHFLKKFSLAALARFRFIPCLEMKACNVLYQLHLYFFLFLGVIIPDWQLPKFTENTHKIAQKCVYYVQKLFAGDGGGRKERVGGWVGKTWKLGGIAPWLLGGGIDAPARRRPTVSYCIKPFRLSYKLHKFNGMKDILNVIIMIRSSIKYCGPLILKV